jgi:hypothetical protein
MASKVRIDGSQTFWKLCDHFDRETLHDGLKDLGWSRNCPLARSNSSALKEALQELVRQWGLKSVLVRPLDNVDEDGYAVVHEDTGSVTNDYDTLFTVKWVKPSENVEPYAVVTEYSHKVDHAAIDQWFKHYRKRITSHAVAKMLRVIITEQLSGISLRPSGGFYWLPADSLESYDKLIQLVYKAADDRGKCKVYVPGFNLSDPGAVEAVRDAIIDDINARRERIEELASGDKIKKRALENRRKDAQALHQRVKAYESYLGETLGELHKAADNCEKHVVDAALREFPDFFGINDKAGQEAEPVQPMVTPEEVTANDVNPFAIPAA